MRRRRSAAFLVLGLGVALAAVSIGPAQAANVGTAGVLEYKKDSRRISNLQAARPDFGLPAIRWGQAKAGCTGQLATGAGLETRGSIANSYIGGIQGGRRVDGWQLASEPVQKLFAHAICGDESAKRAERFANFADLSAGGNFVSVPCKGKARYITGGGLGTQNWLTGGFVHSLFPVDGPDSDSKPNDAWGGWVHLNPSMLFGASGLTAELAALCQRREPKYRQKSIELSGADEITTTVRCRKREHVTGGGASITGDTLAAHVSSTFPIDGRDRGKVPDDGWRIRAASDSAAVKTLTAYAICAKKMGKP